MSELNTQTNKQKNSAKRLQEQRRQPGREIRRHQRLDRPMKLAKQPSKVVHQNSGVEEASRSGILPATLNPLKSVKRRKKREIQFQVVSPRSEKPIRATSRLSAWSLSPKDFLVHQVRPTLPERNPTFLHPLRTKTGSPNIV